MFFELGSKRIEKKKNLFKEHIKDLLYNNIVNKILLLVADEYSDIKTYLNSQVMEYYKNIDGYESDNDEYYIANKHINTTVYQHLMYHSTQYYNKVMKNESITSLWDLIGLFIECGSLFTNGSVTDIGAFNFNSIDITNFKLIEPIPKFIKYENIYQDVIVSFKNKINNNKDHIIIIEFAIWPIGKQDSVFCNVIETILFNLFSNFYIKFCYESMSFNGKYFMFYNDIPKFEIDNGQIFISVNLMQNEFDDFINEFEIN